MSCNNNVPPFVVSGSPKFVFNGNVLILLNCCHIVMIKFAGTVRIAAEAGNRAPDVFRRNFLGFGRTPTWCGEGVFELLEHRPSKPGV